MRRLQIASLLAAVAVLVSAPWTLRASARDLGQGPGIPSLTEPGEELAVLQSSPNTGRAVFAAVRGQSRGILLPVAPTDPAAERAAVFIDHYGQAFGLGGRGDVRLTRATARDDLGVEHVRFQQLMAGVPVAGGELVVHLRGNRAVGANGRVLDRLPADMAPAVMPAAAQNVARQVIGRYHAAHAGTARYSEPRLEVVNRDFLGSRRPSLSRLGWFVEATGPGLRQFIWIDANTGDLVLQFSQMHAAKNRHVYNAFNGPSLPGTSARVEGAGPTGNAEVDSAYDLSGDTYDFYFNVLGRDSFNGAGAQIISTVNFNDGVTCPNAFWNGTQMVYCNGFASADDVVGHELTHAVVQYEANLFYFTESGALNESFADIFGETIDLFQHVTGSDTPGVRWQMGEELPPPFGAIRNMMDPTLFGDPGKVSDVTLFRCDPLDGDGGGVHSNSGVPNHAYALMVDGGSYNGHTISGIGFDKAARVQYRALSTYLTSSSNFLDNFTALVQSCSDLIGTAGITQADCTQVENAARAVEMNAVATCRDPDTALHPNVSMQAAMCPAGGSPTFVLQENFETGLPGWTTTAPQRWFVQNFFVQEGAISGFGQDPGFLSDHRLTSPAVLIPPGGRLIFSHSFAFENFGGTAFDGGVLEYSTDGTTWVDTWPLMDAGYMYNRVINADGTANALAGRSAFAMSTLGYETTRLNVAGLAGQNVRFRWRIGSDEIIGADGWFLDNVRIYSCATAPGAPVILLGPQPTAVTGGAQAAFSVSVAGNGPLRYQWMANGVPISTPSATTANLTVPNVQYEDWGYYSVVVSNNEGSATSDGALLIVNSPSGPEFINQPESRTIGQGQSVQFVANVLNPAGVSAYSWQFSTNGGASWGFVPNAPPYSGVTTNVFTITGATTALTGTLYRIAATNGVDTAISQTATLTVLPSNLITNGDFGAGPAIPAPWSFFDAPVGSAEWRINGGVFEWNRPGNSTTQATILMNTGVAVNGGPLAAQFDLGNSAPIRQRVSVLLLDSNFTDLSVCTFWLEPGAPMRTYSMRTHPTKPWANAAIYFYAATQNSSTTNGGYLRLDNVSMNFNATGSELRTDCVDPTSPTPPGGTPGPNLIANGNFAGGMTSWETFGTISGAVNNGVFEFIRLPGVPGGVVLQRTGAAVAANEFLTATFDLGNTSAVRKRVTLLLHSNDFSDLAACTFWLRPSQPLTTYQMKMRATKAWAAGIPTGAVFSLYGATTTLEQWIQLDNVTLQRTPGSAIIGTECIEPGETAPPAFQARASEQMAMPPAPPGAPIAPPAPARDQQAQFARLDFDELLSSDWVSGMDFSGTRVMRWKRAVEIDARTGAKLTFVSSVEGGAGSAEVQVSLDGLIWRTVARVPPDEAWTEVQVDLSEFLGHRVYVQFAYTPLLGETAVWRVNNVRVSRRNW